MKVIRIYTDRSRTLTRGKCARRRLYEYHWGPGQKGIQSARKELPLAVGGATHSGIAELLRGKSEDEAVRAAILELEKYRAGFELDAGEQSLLQKSIATLSGTSGGTESYADQLARQAADLGMSTEELEELRRGAQAPAMDAQRSIQEFEEYLWAEQSALVEALVRAYARRRLPKLLEEFEILEVEREGSWKMSEWHGESTLEKYELWWMSRPDALLRHRIDSHLEILSLKTTANWDDRKERDTRHDMQGLSEGVEVDRRLGRWWNEIHRECADQGEAAAVGQNLRDEGITDRMLQFLLKCSVPPSVLAIRYEFMLKGERRKDKELSARLGIDVRSQYSPLVRWYEAVSTPKRGARAYQTGDVCWSWDYTNADGSGSSLSWQTWKSRPAWRNIAQWIDLLDSAAETMSGEDSTIGMAPRSLGWQCGAQRMGFTKQHPLDTVFVPPITVYRNIDDLRDWFEQTEAEERFWAESVGKINEAAPGTPEHRSLLNILAPQNRQSCVYPSLCPYDRDKASVCWGPEEVRSRALENGYAERVPNHPTEIQSKD